MSCSQKLKSADAAVAAANSKDKGSENRYSKS